MEKGIICFETGEFAKYRTDNQFAALPLLEFMKQQMGPAEKKIADYILQNSNDIISTYLLLTLIYIFFRALRIQGIQLLTFQHTSNK